MGKVNWGQLIWFALATIEELAILADLIGGQDPYRHEVMMMLASILVYANDIEGRSL